MPADACNIRNEVFVDEQGFEHELDEIDNIAVHIVVYCEGEPIGVCRYFPGEHSGEYTAGRVAVVKPFRGKGVGRYIMSVIEENVRKDGGVRLFVSSQLRALGFYESCGYKKIGDIYYDEHCPHIKMVKDLTSPIN